jgi:hypothetical protein
MDPKRVPEDASSTPEKQECFSDAHYEHPRKGSALVARNAITSFVADSDPRVPDENLRSLHDSCGIVLEDGSNLLKVRKHNNSSSWEARNYNYF